jgi:N-acetylmuramic acid 6-phosphate etherase
MTEDDDSVDKRPELDQLPAHDVVGLLLAAEERVVPAVRAQAEQLAVAADLIAVRMRAGGRLVFVGAGTSGRLALAQAAELPGTFGLDRARVMGRIAGGPLSTDDDEDDLGLARADVASLALTAADVVVAVAASGRTPYTLAIAATARAERAAVVAVVTMTGSPLAVGADVAVEIDVGPEVLRDSTRLTSGTAQKVALDALTTTAMARLGRVHGDLMVDVVAANAKLRQRKADIVAEIAACPSETAGSALDACGGNARAAIAHLLLGLSPAEAHQRVARFITLRDTLGPRP